MDEAVALVARLEREAEPGGGKAKVATLARAGPVGPGDDKAELVVWEGPEAGIRDGDRSATSFAEAAWVADVDADAAVLGAGVI